MPHIDTVILSTSERTDEAALARLGAAAVLLWDRIEPDTRSHLLSLAPLIAGVTNAPDCSAVLARLIRNSQNPAHIVDVASTGEVNEGPSEGRV
jgi:hypothetical protein